MNNIKYKPVTITNYCDSKLPLCVTVSTDLGSCDYLNRRHISLINKAGMWASECCCCPCLIPLVLLEAGSTTTASTLAVDLYWLIRFYSSPQTRGSC